MRAKNARAPHTVRVTRKLVSAMSTDAVAVPMEDFAGEGGQELLTGDGLPTHAYSQEKAQLEVMNRELTQMILKMNTLSYQGLLLNVDIVSQFDPAVVQELNGLVEDCEACIARIKDRTEQSLQCLHIDQSHTADSGAPIDQE